MVRRSHRGTRSAQAAGRRTGRESVPARTASAWAQHLYHFFRGLPATELRRAYAELLCLVYEVRALVKALDPVDPEAGVPTP